MVFEYIGQEENNTKIFSLHLLNNRWEGEPLRRQRGRACPPRGSRGATPRQGVPSRARAGRLATRSEAKGVLTLPPLAGDT